jgi:hypothetical protein
MRCSNRAQVGSAPCRDAPGLAGYVRRNSGQLGKLEIDAGLRRDGYDVGADGGVEP